MNDTKQSVSEKSPEYLAATLREVAEMLEDVSKTIRSCDARLGAWRADKPKTVAVDTTPVVGKVAFAAVDTLFVEICQDGKPYLRIAGMADGTQREEWTRTPIADIRTQAAAAGMELPEVTVSVDGYQLTAIERADCHVCDNGSLLTDIIGVAEQYGEHTIHTSTLTPAQVCALCALAGWPKPQVRMVCTYTDGAPCEVGPENISGVGVARHATTIETNTPLADGRCVHHVREPVAVVEAMIDVCQEGE
jgi:hypothetical protein